MSPVRWQAKAVYRTESDPVDVAYGLVEIADLHGIIKAGPHWDTIVRIEIIRVNYCQGASLMVEQAART